MLTARGVAYTFATRETNAPCLSNWGHANFSVGPLVGLNLAYTTQTSALTWHVQSKAVTQNLCLCFAAARRSNIFHFLRTCSNLCYAGCQPVPTSANLSKHMLNNLLLATVHCSTTKAHLLVESVLSIGVMRPCCKPCRHLWSPAKSAAMPCCNRLCYTTIKPTKWFPAIPRFPPSPLHPHLPHSSLAPEPSSLQPVHSQHSLIVADSLFRAQRRVDQAQQKGGRRREAHLGLQGAPRRVHLVLGLGMGPVPASKSR